MTLSTSLAETTWVQDWWDQITWLAPFIAGAVLYFVRREVKGWKASVIAEVKRQTAEIQPGKNGGVSLSDANGKLDQLKLIPTQLENLTALVQRVDATTQALDTRLTDAIAAVGTRVDDVGRRVDGHDAFIQRHLQSHS